MRRGSSAGRRDVVHRTYYSGMETTVLPVVGEAPQDLIDLVSGGQPVVLLGHDGEPVAVVLDFDSYQESESLVES
jgi:hypothetical protein